MPLVSEWCSQSSDQPQYCENNPRCICNISYASMSDTPRRVANVDFCIPYWVPRQSTLSRSRITPTPGVLRVASGGIRPMIFPKSRYGSPPYSPSIGLFDPGTCLSDNAAAAPNSMLE